MRHAAYAFEIAKVMTSNAIELTGVTKRFGQHTAVRDLDLQVPTGSIHGFIGPNGSGKTTTIRMILRIFHPDEGQVMVLGRTHGDCADDLVGYLPEERGLYRRMKVRDLLRYYASLKGFRDSDAQISYWLERLGAPDWGSKKIDSLSKGMAQKVQFISAVIARPQLLILDEPFSGLDPVNLELLRDAILEVRDQGTTIIFSTHEMDVAERLCDTVFMIHNGVKVLDGSVSNIQSTYPADEVKIRLADNSQLPDEISGVLKIEKQGSFWLFKLDPKTRTDQLLAQLIPTCRIEHFELLRPSLHNIFVRIAGTDSKPVAPSTASVA